MSEHLEQRSSAYSWFVVAVLCALNMSAAVDQFVMSIAIVPLKGDLRLTDTELGLLSGVGFGLLYCIAGVPCGRLADSVSRRRMLLVGCILWTTATAACAFVNSFAALFATRVLVGLAQATLMPAAVSLIADYVGRRRLGLANGVFTMGASAGKALAFIVGGWILSVLIVQNGISLFGITFRPWQALFLASAVPGVIAAALSLAIAEPQRERPSRTMAAASSLQSHVRGHASAICSFAALGSCSVLTAMLYAAWAPSFFVRHYDIPVGEAALIVGVVVALVGPFGSVFGGIVSDALGSRGFQGSPGLVVFSSLLAAVPATALMVLSDDLTLSVIGYGCAQFVIMMGSPQSFAGMQMLVPVRHRGFVSAAYLAIATFAGMGLGPLLIGLFSDLVFHGATTGLGYALLSVVAIFAMLGAICGIIALKRFERCVTAASANGSMGFDDLAGARASIGSNFRFRPRAAR